MSNIIPFNGGALPSYMSATSAVSNNLIDGLGASVPRISLKGSRFSQVVGGNTVNVSMTGTLDVIVVGATAGVSRLFYSGAYDPSSQTNEAPDCYSVDGVTPSINAKARQAASCASCYQNQKGSRIVGTTMSRACSFTKRLAVLVVGDPDNSVYQLDLKSLSIFGNGQPQQNLFTLSEYVKMLQSRHVAVENVITRLSFDLQSSVPKLYFSPVGYIDEGVHAMVQGIVGTQAVTDALDMERSTPTAADDIHSIPVHQVQAPMFAQQAPQYMQQPQMQPQYAPQQMPQQMQQMPQQMQQMPQQMQQMPQQMQQMPQQMQQMPQQMQQMPQQMQPQVQMQQMPPQMQPQVQVQQAVTTIAPPVTGAVDTELDNFLAELGA
jgi:hypothetical protein